MLSVPFFYLGLLYGNKFQEIELVCTGVQLMKLINLFKNSGKQISKVFNYHDFFFLTGALNIPSVLPGLAILSPVPRVFFSSSDYSYSSLTNHSFSGCLNSAGKKLYSPFFSASLSHVITIIVSTSPVSDCVLPLFCFQDGEGEKMNKRFL